MGGGPSGLYFSILMKLADPAHEITVYERHPAGSTYGWGVTFRANLLAGLRASDPGSGAAVESAATSWAGEVIYVSGEPSFRPGGAHSIGRQRLLDILVSRARELGVRVEFSHEVADPSRLPGADLIVASDGVNSQTRQASSAFGTDVQLGANKFLWLGTDKLFTPFTFIFAPTGAGWIWAGAHQFDDATSSFVVECTASTWEGLGFASMTPGESTAALGKIFADHLDGHELVVRAGDGAGAWLNFRTVTNRHWYDGNTVLIGDAAHAMHFSVGSATTLALQDAVALAGALRRHPDLPVALKSYQEEREAAIRQIRLNARCSARWLENIDRYIGLPRHQFLALLADRRAPLQSRLPPRLYYHLQQTTEHVALVRALRAWLGRAAVGSTHG